MEVVSYDTDRVEIEPVAPVKHKVNDVASGKSSAFMTNLDLESTPSTRGSGSGSTATRTREPRLLAGDL